jgi:hypothetical protein
MLEKSLHSTGSSAAFDVRRMRATADTNRSTCSSVLVLILCLLPLLLLLLLLLPRRRCQGQRVPERHPAEMGGVCM